MPGIGIYTDRQPRQQTRCQGDTVLGQVKGSATLWCLPAERDKVRPA